jgi:phage terminase large subunit
LTPAEAIRRWRAEPLTFVRQVIGVEPDAWQATTLAALPLEMRIALAACKGPGKSAILAWIIWWFLTVFPHPKVVASSISGANLRDGLWAELSKWQQKSELLKHTFTWSAERIVCNDHPTTWFASARQWSQSADPSQQANTLAGIHGDAVLFVIDEAGGVPDAVAAAAEAGLANADKDAGRVAKLLIAGNPTHLEGPLYRACTREKKLWWVKRISSAPEDPERTPRVSVKWAQEQIEKYGREHPYVLVNVYGQFPPGQSNTLIALGDAQAAADRVIPLKEVLHEARILGVDVARFGEDRTTFAPRQGRVCYPMKVFRNLDVMQVADQVAYSIERWKPDAVFIDQTGIGAGVVDRLRQLGHVILGVDFGGRALTPSPKLANRRAEMWWRLSEWVKTGGLPKDDELVSELAGPTYHFDTASRIQLESKDDMKKRGLPSPDKADALALTFAAPVQRRPFELPGQERNRHRAVTEYSPLKGR